MKKSNKNDNIKIDVKEYLLMHNKNDVIKALRHSGYKGKTDNESLFKALDYYTKKHKAKGLMLLAKAHPDRELILWSVKQEQNKDVNANGDNEIDNIPENNANASFSNINVKSLLIGTGIALGLVMVIKFVATK